MDSYEDIRILIAEDDYLASEKIKEVVETLGYTVVGEAIDGLEAVEMTEAVRPDVVLMDIKMPRMDGLEATKQIQERCPTPVVILTAYQTSELVTKASIAGVGAYLIKPPQPRYLARTIAIARARFEDMMKLRDLNDKLQAEIEERERVEARLRLLLQEKQILIKEVHHRVKNNLAVVSSLLNIQIETLQDEQARATLLESQNRIRAMARLHEQLYKSKDLTQIEMKSYIDHLTEWLRQSYGVYGVTLQVGPVDAILNMDVAVPCGLIVNELVSNALKHAFPNGTEGQIWVELRLTEGENCLLIVGDNGIGLPLQFDWQRATSLGLQLVNLLVQQIEGTIELEKPETASAKRPGTIFKISFPAEQS